LDVVIFVVLTVVVIIVAFDSGNCGSVVTDRQTHSQKENERKKEKKDKKKETNKCNTNIPHKVDL